MARWCGGTGGKRGDEWQCGRGACGRCRAPGLTNTQTLRALSKCATPGPRVCPPGSTWTQHKTNTSSSRKRVNPRRKSGRHCSAKHTPLHKCAGPPLEPSQPVDHPLKDQDGTGMPPQGSTRGRAYCSTGSRYCSLMILRSLKVAFAAHLQHERRIEPPKNPVPPNRTTCPTAPHAPTQRSSLHRITSLGQTHDPFRKADILAEYEPVFEHHPAHAM